MSDDYFKQVAEIINKNADFNAAVNDDEDSDYLMWVVKINKYDEFCFADGLVVMYDYGVTWEPCKAYTTPQYCEVAMDNAELAAKQLIALADAFESGELPMNGRDGCGYKFIEDLTV